MLQKTLSRILGCALLSYGGAALAFTIILPPPGIPQELVTPSTDITNSFTLQAQVQPIAGTIRAQIFGLRRPGGPKNVTQVGGMKLAANDRSGSRSDVNYLAAAANDPSGAGGGSGGGNAQSLWISSTYDSLENTFFRTAFYGATQNVLVGYDFTRSDKYVLGISGGYEASNFVTKFNAGNEKTGGYNINPYFAWLISDAWSLDLIGGYGKFDTDQSRTISSAGPIPTPVDSQFSSTRSFASTNLTNISGWGNWKLTSSLGYLWSKRDQDAYTESNGIPVTGSNQTSKQWNLLEEIAYGRGNSETFFGARYEDIRNYQKIELTLGLGEQPANDPTSFLLIAGWRYFGKGLTASFVFSGRVAQEQVKEHGFSMVLRADI